MIRVLAVLLALMAAQAQALSCVRPDVARAFQQADASDKTYVVLRGSFAFDTADLPKRPKRDPNATVPLTIVPATFTGHSLTRQGFTAPLTAPASLAVSCIGPWCGSAQPDTPMIAFARKVGSTYVVDVDACSSTTFANPTARMETTLRRCLRGGRCKPGSDF